MVQSGSVVNLSARGGEMRHTLCRDGAIHEKERGRHRVNGRGSLGKCVRSTAVLLVFRKIRAVMRSKCGALELEFVARSARGVESKSEGGSGGSVGPEIVKVMLGGGGGAMGASSCPNLVRSVLCCAMGLWCVVCGAKGVCSMLV